MKRLALTAAVLLLLAPTAYAQGHSHADKGPHGAPMQDVVGVHAEMVTAERTLTVHLYDEAGKPVPATGYTASALVGSGQARQVVQLAPGDGNTLAGTATVVLARGASVTLQIKAPGGKSGQAKF